MPLPGSAIKCYHIVHKIALLVFVVGGLPTLGLRSSQFAKPPYASASWQTDDAGLSQEGIREGERRLVELGYWIAPPNNEQSSQALIAFQKVERRKPTGQWTIRELAAIKRATRPAPRETGFEHIEIDLARQVLFVVDRDSVKLILPVATGTGKLFVDGGWTRRAITPVGRFTVYRKVEGWRDSSLGQLYYPNYITRGIAIHGSRSVSTDPSSFGCIRIPMYAALEFSKITPLGTVVIVYGKFNHRSTQTSLQ